MPAPTQQVTVTMSQPTVEALGRSGYWLYTYAAVQTPDAAAVPLVWQRTQQYSLSTAVSWTPSYQGYTAPSASLAAGSTVVPGFAAALAPGQTLQVTSTGGNGSVVESGVPGTLAVLNQTTAQFTCGVSLQQGNGLYAAACATPLYGGTLQLVQSTARVLLLFTTQDTPPGTVCTLATGPGVMIDMTGASSRAVTFDMNQGWSWGGGTWAAAVAAESPLVPLLVRPTQQLQAGR